MKKKCLKCQIVNYADAEICVRCGEALSGERVVSGKTKRKSGGILTRAIVCLAVVVVLFVGFYVSLVGSAKSLSIDQKSEIRAATRLIGEKGFSREAAILGYLAVFRGSDNWLNASVAKENAYAATNFPFEIITVYSDFFAYPKDDTERAAILLHEARHMAGENEHDAYEFVWQNRRKLGWTSESYGTSAVWQNIRNQTKENVPEMFTCEGKPLGDCTE